MEATKTLRTGQIVRINPDPYDAIIVDINHKDDQILVQAKTAFTTHVQWVDVAKVEVPR